MADAQPPVFGALLKRFRLAAGLSQEALAERARMSAQAISALERGVRKTPYRDTVTQIADALALPEDERAVLAAAAVRRYPPRETAPLPIAPLSIPSSALIGRDADIKALNDALDSGARLLTLTGPGGIGKTRLAIAFAVAANARFEDGVTTVSLASLRDPALVASATAAVIGLRVGATQSAEEAVIEFLRDQRRLVILDNFEQVLPASSFATRVLEQCNGVTLIVTSRAALRVSAEREFNVAALETPSDATVEPSQLQEFSGTQLFLERVRSFNQHYEPSPDDAQAIAGICRRLDGLPLAIELAAPLTRFYSPATLLKRLDRSLDVLVMGSRDVPRQQTMRKAIDWSYELLSAADQEVFRRLGVFVGGWAVEGAALVCMSDEHRDEIFERLAALLDLNLLHQDEQDGEIRVGMLEIVREFAFERLGQSGELELMRSHLARHMHGLCKDAGDGLMGADQAAWYARLDLEIGNIRAALQWAKEQRLAPLGLAIAMSIQRYWEQRGLFAEGLEWLELFLAQADAMPSFDKALLLEALISAGVLADRRDEYVRSRQLFERAAARARTLGASVPLARALSWLGNGAQAQGDYDAAAAYHRESLATARTTGDPDLLALTLNNYGLTVRDRGDLDEAVELFVEALALARAGRVPLRIALIASNLGVVQRRRGRLDDAAKLLEESARLRQEVGDRWGTVVVLTQLGDVALERGDAERAESYYRGSLRSNRLIGVRELFAMALEGMARIAMQRPDDRAGVLYASAAARERIAIGVPSPQSEQASLDAALELARKRLGDQDYERAWADGSVRSLHDVVSAALSSAV